MLSNLLTKQLDILLIKEPNESVVQVAERLLNRKLLEATQSRARASTWSTLRRTDCNQLALDASAMHPSDSSQNNSNLLRQV